VNAQRRKFRIVPSQFQSAALPCNVQNETDELIGLIQLTRDEFA
jgi:hypothetical protein